jgi:carbamate kinase
MSKLAVIALGGNALLRDNQKGTFAEQEFNTSETLENIMFLIKEGYNIVISHGNGPQVGNIVMRNDAGENLYSVPQMPLDVCVADSQGGIGYMIERELRNILNINGIDRDILTLMTMVEVDIDDDAFKNPTKRIGKTMTREEADRLSAAKGWTFKQEKKQVDGFRRVVPSPSPLHIVNSKAIEKNAKAGTIIIAVGGGGVPVYRDSYNKLRSVEAVIDKDLASALLANEIGADEFYILTDVPYVYANYGQPDQKILEFLNYKDTLEYYNNGTFGEGSMAPKIKAALSFIERGGTKSIITESNKLENKDFGTKITMEYDLADLNKYKNRV